MKNRVICLLLAVLLTLSLAACGKRQTDPASEGEATGGNGTNIGFTPEEGPNNQRELPEGTVDKGFYLLEHGHPYGFTVSFSCGNMGFDTAASQLREGSSVYPYDFSPMLANLYYDFTEHDFFLISEDLTYEALAGAAPEGENVVYTLTATEIADGETDGEEVTVTYTRRIDSAAMAAYGTRPDVQNAYSLMTELRNILERELGHAKNPTP